VHAVCRLLARCLVVGSLAAGLANTATGEPPVVTIAADAPRVETVSLRELWRLDLGDPDAPLVGALAGVEARPDGSILVLDHQLAQVLILSADGELLGTVGRRGEGPGEIQSPTALVLPGDGRIGVLQTYPACVVFLDPDGTPAGRFAPENPSFLVQRFRMRGGVNAASGQIMGQMAEPGTSVERLRIVRLDDQGAIATTYLQKDKTTSWDPPIHDERASWFAGFRWDLLADGTLVVAPDRDRYRLEFRAPDGSVQRVVTRPFTPRRRTREDRERIADGVTFTSNGQEVDVDVRLLDTDPAIQGVTAMPDGTLRIANAYFRSDLPEGIAGRWDVLDAEGQWVKELRLAADVDWRNDHCQDLGDGRWLVIHNAGAASAAAFGQTELAEDLGDDPMVIVCCEAVPLAD